MRLDTVPSTPCTTRNVCPALRGTWRAWFATGITSSFLCGFFFLFIPRNAGLTGTTFAADVDSSRPVRSSVATSPLPVHLWWTRTRLALDVLDRAPEFKVTGLVMENDLGNVGWGDVLNGMCNYDFSDRCRCGPEERARVEALRAQYRRIITKARHQGVDCYVMCPEVHAPASFGPLSYDDPALWALIHDRLREVFQALPDLTGYVLYLTEGPQLDVENLPGRELSKTRRAKKLIETCWRACKAEKRKMMVTTFIHSKAMLDAIAEALREIPPDPDFAVLQYCCPNDWGLYQLLNPSIGRVGPHPEILGFDPSAENWGQGAHPFIQSEFMSRRLREARARSKNIAGVAGYIAWTYHSALGTLNEASVYTAMILRESPDRDGKDILREWCVKRFGEKAADVAAACLARTQPATMKAQHVFGYWVDTSEKSGLPTLSEIDLYFIRDIFGEALGKWDPSYLPTWEKIRNPDDSFLTKVLKEKEEAIRMRRQSLKELRAAKDRFRPEDFKLLERAFVFQELWARLWREEMHAFFLRQIATKQGWTSERKAQIEKVLQQFSAEADELEAGFGKDVFPRGPQRARDFIHDVRKQIPN